MGIQTQKVKTYIENYICDECGEGVMQQTGNMEMSDYPQFEHICSKCGSTQNFGKKYPTPVYVLDDEWRG